MVYGVIMAGGRGERFWPLSRRERPKQFLCLASDKMMLEETIDRILPMIPLDNIRIVTARSMLPLIEKNLPQIGGSHVLDEPVGRNTCGAIGLAAVHLLHADPEAVMIVLSADHLIRPPAKLLEILGQAVDIASKGDYLITMGIVPTRAETGYGYIRSGEPFAHSGSGKVFHVAAFAEKPRPAVAKEYYFSGNYLWNSGMFVWSAKSVLDAIGKCIPDMGRMLDDYAACIGQPSEAEARDNLYRELPSVSIDVGVLECATNVITVQADIVWDDVGDWNSLSRYRTRDSDNNVLIGRTEAMDTYETTVYNDSDGIVACLGVSDLVVVTSGKITLVVHKTKTQQVKELLARLAENDDSQEYL